MINITEVR